MFPTKRLRRLRQSEGLRALARETRLDPRQLVQPVFVQPGLDGSERIASMPGVERLGLKAAAQHAKRLEAAGVGGVLVFGLPGHKDAQGSGAWASDGAAQQGIAAVKGACSLPVIADLCLCAFTTHGHCGVLGPSGLVENDATLDLYGKAAVSLARAGADVIAPSGMMDGQVRAIRAALDTAGFEGTPILSYAAKYASAFYGPFRDAAHSAPSSGDRRSHQLDPANAREALREVDLDLAEGADMVMVKPAGPCLDVVRAVRERFDAPLAAYQVSGEYSMLLAAVERGWLDRRAAVLESLVAIRRAGADVVLTYFAEEAAAWL